MNGWVGRATPLDGQRSSVAKASLALPWSKLLPPEYKGIWTDDVMMLLGPAGAQWGCVMMWSYLGFPYVQFQPSLTGTAEIYPGLKHLRQQLLKGYCRFCLTWHEGFGHMLFFT